MIRFLIGFSSTFFNTAGLPGSIICYRVDLPPYVVIGQWVCYLLQIVNELRIKLWEVKQVALIHAALLPRRMEFKLEPFIVSSVRILVPTKTN